MSYPFSDRATEDERLVAQGRLFDPLTDRLLRQAGLAHGMRALDLGRGRDRTAPGAVPVHRVPRRRAAGRDPRLRRLRHRPPDDRGLGDAAMNSESVGFEAIRKHATVHPVPPRAA